MAKAKKDVNLRISVLLYREGDVWVGQCLEHDINAQGGSLDEVQRRLRRTFIGQIALDVSNGREPLKDTAKAPAVFWERFKSSSHRLRDQKPFTVPDLPPAYIVNAITEEAIFA